MTMRHDTKGFRPRHCHFAQPVILEQRSETFKDLYNNCSIDALV